MAGKGTNKTIIDSITPSTVLDPGVAGGRVRCMLDDYTGTGAEVLTTLTVKMGGALPLNARIVGVTIDCGALGGGHTINVGDAESTGRYISAAAASTCTYMNVNAGLNYKVDMTTAATPDNQILLTLSGTVALAAKVYLAVFYTID